MLLSIISGTYNRLEYLKAMVASARKSMPPRIDYEFVITDGGSTDGTLEWMKDQKDIRVIEHGELRGAIKAFNDAGAAATGDYLIPANDDIEFNGFSIAKGLAFMMDHPEVGAGCFYQDRGNKAMHVEKMPMYNVDGGQDWLPYIQVGIIPKWLWDRCEGWGNWGGRTYGGDNYISLMIYETGYKVTPIEGCSIKDKTAVDDLRALNNKNNKDGEKLWAAFPGGTRIPEHPVCENPLPMRKRVIYAPIIEKGHDIQKEQKRGLRDALGALGIVWEVDYIYASESIVDATEAWNPHYTITQIHHADAVSMDDIKRVKEATKNWMVNWNGDVWQETQSDPRYLEFMRYFDYQLCVNAALFPVYAGKGVNAAYWQNSAEPQVSESEEISERHDVVFLGNRYSDYREDLARAIKSTHGDVAIFGRGYPDDLSSGESLYDYRKTGMLYRGAKIAVADNQYPDATGFCSDRLFMTLSAGGCMLMHQRVHKMQEFLGLVDGVHYVSWTDLDDLKEKIAYYLSHEEERKKISEAGTLEFLANHTFAKRVEELKALILKLPNKGKKKTISAMLLVKDEFDELPRVLSELKWADEVVIVCTAQPSDEACLKNILEEEIRKADPPIKTGYFKWTDDFSEARNFAKSLCTSDWIFWMDPRDSLDPYLIKRLSNFSEWEFSRIGVANPQAFRFLCLVKRGDEVAQTGYQIKLFCNLEAIKWTGKVHENVGESLSQLGIHAIPYKGMKVYKSWDDDPVKTAQKQEYYIKLLKTEAPGAWTFYQIAMSFATMKRWGDAMVWADKAIRFESNKNFENYLNFFCGYCLYQMGLKEEAISWLKKSTFLDAFYLLAEILRERKVFRADLYKAFLLEPLPESLPTFAPIWEPLARESLLEWHHREIETLEK